MSLGYDDLAGMEVQIPGGGGGDGGTGGGLGGAGGGFPNAFDSVAAGSNGGGGNNRNQGSSNNFAAGLRHHWMGAGVGGIGGLENDGALITDTETVDDGSRSNFTGRTTAGAVNGNGAGRRSKQQQQQQQQQAKGKSNTTMAAKTMAAKGTAKSSGEDLVDKTTTGSDVTATATAAAGTAAGTATGNSKKRKDPPANPTADLEESIRAEAGGQYRRAVAEFEAHLETVRRATDQALDGLKTFLDAAVETRIAYARAQHSTDGEAARIARMEPEVQAATAAMMGAGGGPGGGGGGGGTGGSAAAIAAMMGGMLGGGAMGGAFGGGGFN